MDLRALNESTIKNRYPLPLVKGTRMRLAHARIFTKLDVCGAYTLIRMKDGDEWKTVFRTRYWPVRVVSDVLRTHQCAATFLNFINDALSPYLDNFATAYLDDILIYSNNLQEHQDHVKQILAALTKQGLYRKPDKCEFHAQEVKYLGLIVGTEGIKMDQAKVEAIEEWPPPERLRDIRAFPGFANFCQRFIKGYCEIIRLITLLMQKARKFKRGQNQKWAFEGLKEAFTT